MKKALVTSIAFVLVFAVAALAQESTTTTTMTTEKGLAGYGIQAGVSLANATGSDADAPAGFSKKMLLGFAGGVFVQYQIVPQFAVALEPMYVMKGVKYSATGTAKFKLNYIEVPLVGKFTPTMEGNIKPTIFAGPFLGIKASAKVKSTDMTGADTLVFPNEDIDIKDQVKSTDFGVTFGAGVSYGLTKGAIFLNARYDLGLSKILKERTETIDGTTVTVKPNLKSTAIMVLVGYNFK